MAVFPDRIVLKNSTDSQAAIESAIGSGGTDEITQGEIVLGLEAGSAKIYTRDSSGAIVEIAGALASIDEIGDVDTSTVAPTDGQALVWDNTAQQWEPGSVAASSGRGDGGDFDTGTVDSAYVFGVYGGGDFSTGSNDLPAELLGGDEGPDGGSF